VSVRDELPGDVWSLSAAEAHCLKTALDRLEPFLDDEQAGDLAVWDMALSLEGPFQVTPTDGDRVFLEMLIAGELAALWQSPKVLDCDCAADEHLDVLRELQRRAITSPKASRSERERRQPSSHS